VLVTAVEEAPTKGAIPRPPLEPIDIIWPALGNWFWFILSSRTISAPFVEVIPLKTKLVTPTVLFSIKS